MLLRDKIESPEFKTHLNYLTNLNRLSSGIRLNYNNRINPNTQLTKYRTKGNLFNLTMRSIRNEMEIVNADISYSKAVCSWIPIKSYYLCFNILLTILYLITTDEKDFLKSHTAIIEIFTGKIKNKDIEFSNKLFNNVYDFSILSFSMPTGFNISKPLTNLDEVNLFKLSLKKIAEYKLEEFKRIQKLNLRKKEDKIKFENYKKNKFQVSVFDFLYQMRLRANYRDFTFIESIDDDQAFDYFTNYYSFLMNVISSLSKLFTEIKSKRGL